MTTTADAPAHKPWPVAPDDLHALIRHRAEEIYIRNGRVPGRDAENWRQAEAEIQTELDQRFRRTAVVVNVAGVQYVGEYSPESAQGYTPGEFAPGQPIPVRFDGEKMFLQRANGAELETTIVESNPRLREQPCSDPAAKRR